MATTVDYSYKQIWRVAYPILVSLLMEQMIVLTDTAFMGRVGEVELGAAAIAGVFYMVIFMAGHGFCVGTQILIARRNGERRYGEVGQVFYQGLYFLMALAAVLFVVCQMYADEILSMMISSPNILAKAEDYIHWRVYGFFFAFAGGMFRSFYVGTTQTKTLTLNSIVMVLSNVVFNYVLVFGKCGLPALGIAGAAIGSSLAELVSLVFFIGYTRAKIDCRHFGLSRFPALDIKRQRSILSVSMWVMVQSFVSLSTWFIFFVYIEHLGEESLAIANLARNISGLPFMMVIAFASAASSIVSNMIGAGQTDKVALAIRRHIWLAYLCVVPLLLVVVAFPQMFIRIYTDIPQLIDAAVPTVWVMCSAYTVLVPANVLFSSVSGTGDTRMAFWLEMAALVFYMIYNTWVVYIMRVDVMWAWTAEIVYGSLMFAFCGAYMRRGSWRRRSI